MKMRVLSFSFLLALAPVATVAGQGQSGAPAPQGATTPQAQSLPLTMREAVAMALDANLDLKAGRLNPDVAAHSVAIAKSAFLPQVQSTLRKNSQVSQPSDFTQGRSDISTGGVSVSAGVSQNVAFYGGSYSVNWLGSRGTQSGGFPSFNPNIYSSLDLAYSQPLLRGMKIDSTRVGVTNAEQRRVITDLQLEQQVVSMEASVRLAYLGLVGAIEGRKVAEQNLDIAETSLRQSKARVQVGQAPQIEIIQFEAQAATARERMIATEAEIARAEDNLRTLILDPARADYWTVRLLPSDQILLEERPVDVDAAVKNALANRLDLKAEQRSLDITNLSLDLSKNSTMPSVDLNVAYSTEGRAGTIYDYASGFPPVVSSATTRTFRGALGDVFGAAYPAWSVGVTVGYPIGRTAEKASYAQGEVAKRQQELGLKQLELEIVREVRDAARQVQNSFQRVQAARVALDATQQQLEAEERRSSVGLSTPLELQIRQRDLANSRINELNARIAYNQALIIFERVQKTR